MIVDLYAGCGGWSEGLGMLGLSDVGIELDEAACLTRAAAGHLTIRADVATFPRSHFAGRVEGLIASPPCQDYSVAGTGAGRSGERGRLIDTVPHWVKDLRPRWVACEQVPPALPIWREHASLYRALGYSTWCGVLNAADFGVPQTRQRAFLLASREGLACPPPPTHCEGSGSTLLGDLAPWVSIEDVLGWAGEMRHVRGAGMTKRHGTRPSRGSDRPAFTITGRADDRIVIALDRRQPGRPLVAAHRPAPTLTATAGAKSQWLWLMGDDTTRHLTLEEALVLQSFRPDYPLRGGVGARFRQVGDAVPPGLAAQVLAAVRGTCAAATRQGAL